MRVTLYRPRICCKDIFCVPIFHTCIPIAHCPAKGYNNKWIMQAVDYFNSLILTGPTNNNPFMFAFALVLAFAY